MKPVYYMQTDPQWSKVDYSAPGETTTISKSGCGPTCMAMIIATLKDAAVTPVDTCKWALSKGYKALKQGTYHSYFVTQGEVFDIDVKQVNKSNLRGTDYAKSKSFHTAALDAVKNGDLVIACMGPGLWTSGGHYILWYGVEGDNVLVNDPASTAPHRAKAPLAVMQAEVKYYWIVKNTKKEQEVPEGMDDIFKDVKSNRWSAKHIRAAKSMGIMLGDDAGNFNPTQPITREEQAVVSMRLYEKITGKKVVV